MSIYTVVGETPEVQEGSEQKLEQVRLCGIVGRWAKPDVALE